MDYVSKTEIGVFRDQIQRAMDYLDIAMNMIDDGTDENRPLIIADLAFDELFHLRNQLNSILKS